MCYCKLAHSSLEVFNKLVQTSLLKLDIFSCPIVCSSCTIAKYHWLPFTHMHTLDDTTFALLYIDLWTSPIVANIGARHFLLIVND